MRQQREASSESKKFELTPEIIMELGKFLDSKQGLHINEVYITQEGYFYNCHEFKKEKYSKVALEPMWNDAVKGYKLTKIGKEEDKVIKTLQASDLVDQYLKLKKK